MFQWRDHCEKNMEMRKKYFMAHRAEQQAGGY